MGFIAWLFGEKQRIQKPTVSPNKKQQLSTTNTPLYAMGTQIAYDSHLIERFLDDHHNLVDLFIKTRTAFIAGDVARAMVCLNLFRNNIQEHLLVEEIRLYVYLRHTLNNNELSRTLMKNMHREMASIGSTVINFLNKYSELNKNPELHSSFIADLDQLGEVLTDRIKCEESSLYPLYLPPNDIELDDSEN